jgi:hypothetical protein
MKDIKIIISSILIIISFFIWYYFAETKNKNKEISKNYVNLEILKTKIKISKDKNTIITINWNIEDKNEYKLK